MNILNLPHLNVIPGDLLESVERVWISDKKCAIITKSDKVYTINTEDPSHQLIYVPELCGKKVIDVIFGSRFTIALNLNGQIYSWGENSFGQLGLGHNKETPTPTRISSLSDKKVIKIACCDFSVMALCEDGEVFGWGYSTKSTRTSIPTKCNKVNSGVSIACSDYVWSLNPSYPDDGVYGQVLPVRTFFNEKGENKLRFPGGYTEFENIIEKVVCGRSHVLVLDSEGKVQIASYTETTFKQLDISEKIIDIAATSATRFSAAMADNKTIFVWISDKSKPYPTSFVTFQEAFLSLSEPVTSYGVFHLKATNSARNLNIDVQEFISKAFDEPEDSDFTILVEEKKIHVHKLILKARSSYFRTMFRDQWQENKENQLKIKDYSYEVFKTYLKYLYGMDIDITSKNVIDLMRIADQYMDEALGHLITKKVESDETISRPINVLKEIMGWPASEYEVLCEGQNKLIFSKHSSSKF